MRIALAGVGKMGGAIAERLRATGHQLSLYDVAPVPGVESAPSLAAAARGADLVLLSLPGAPAVEGSVPGLLEARPPICVDLTSSVPAVTRRVGAELASGGVAFMDCPLSGGVVGARTGRLTAMAGGDPELLERVRPVLAAFASNIVWAGSLGAGHAVKAVNNSLSAVSLTATSEMLVLAAAHGIPETEAVERFNAGPSRSQNSEVKFPRDVVTRTYDAGFAAGLMEKDFATGLEIARAVSVEVPLMASAFDVWREMTAEIGPGADFTRVHAVVAARSSERSHDAGPDGFSLEVLVRALASINLLAAREMLPVLDAEGLERERALAIINASTGRTEATRSGGAGEVDHPALRLAHEFADGAGVWAPLTTLAAGGVRS